MRILGGRAILETLTGQEAAVRGALRAGCDCFVTPAGAMTEAMLQGFRRVFAREEGRQVSHAVDVSDAPEAARQCLEAATRGAKVMVATNGPALRACGEWLGLAQAGAVPLVIVHCQHLGSGEDPITGDVDVALARHLTPCGVCLPVLAATDARSTYRLTQAAFSIAEHLRTPVVLLSSKDIALTPQSVDLEAVDTCTDRPAPAGSSRVSAPDEATPDRCSPGRSLASIGDEWAASLREPARLEALLTRLRDTIKQHRDRLDITVSDIDPDAETLLVSYGLADQSARQAVAIVREAGSRVSHLTLHSLWPIPERAIRRAMTPFVRRVLLPELNVGLYAEAIAGVVKSVKIESILRYDGRQIEPGVIAQRVTHWPCG